MPVPAERVGRLFLVRTAASVDDSVGVVVYARVSSHDQRADLDRQLARLTWWADEQRGRGRADRYRGGFGAGRQAAQAGRILSDPDARVIVVEHRDRLARLGVGHLEAALSAQGRRVLVADPGETSDDLVRDMIEVLTSMCASLDGRRGARNRAMRALTAAKRDPGEAG